MLNQLLNQLVGSDDGDCEAGAVALGKMGESVLPHLTALLADGNADARFWVVRALWVMDTPAATQELIRVLDDPDEMVRSGAALALGELKAESAVERLAQLVQDEEGAPGDHAADALSKIGGPAADFLISALEDARSRVRIRAVRALVPIQSHEAIPALFQALDDDSYVVRHYAEDALGRMGVGHIVYIAP
jgi:HEAT repeat protein